jgi:hypothetical protein
MRTPSKLLRIVASGMLATVLMQTATAQQVEQDVAAASEWIAISFSPDSSSELDFVGTPAAPGASGEVDVKISDEKTVIRGKFQKLPEPSALGPFAVYILWVVTPGGRAINIGMLTKAITARSRPRRRCRALRSSSPRSRISRSVCRARSW